MPDWPRLIAPACWVRRRERVGLALLVAALCGSLPPRAVTAEPPRAEAPLLAASLESRLHEPPPEDYAQYELLPKLAERKEFELQLAPEDSWQLVPRESSLRVEVERRDYREIDSGRPRLTTSALDANEQRSIVGGRVLATRPWRETGRVHTEARMLWLCEFIQNADGPTSFFAPGNSQVFVTQGLRYGSNWALLGGRVSWDLAGGLKAFAAYDAQVNSLEMFHIGSTGLGYTW